MKIRFAAFVRWLAADGLEVAQAAYATSISNTGASLVVIQQPRAGQSLRVTLDIEGQRGQPVGGMERAQVLKPTPHGGLTR